MSTPAPPAIHPISYLTLPSRPTAQLAYTFIPGKIPSVSPSTPPPLLIFLNGLALPSTSWHATISLLQSLPTHPPILAYDRYGQGQGHSDPDPLDATAPDPKHAHDCLSLVSCLSELISTVTPKFALSESISKAGIFFVVNSLGGAIVRLYTAQHPGVVTGIMFLDSVMANTDFVSIFPDPDAEGFEEADLPEGVTAEGLRETRGKFGRMFHPEVGSGEGTSRRNLRGLLPRCDVPRLVGFGEEGKRGPWITVVGHGCERFAEEGWEGMGVPPVITKTYMNPFWHEYNVGLTKLTSLERSRGPILAEKCGHFIQRDDPELVAGIIELMLEAMRA